MARNSEALSSRSHAIRLNRHPSLPTSLIPCLVLCCCCLAFFSQLIFLQKEFLSYIHSITRKAWLWSVLFVSLCGGFWNILAKEEKVLVKLLKVFKSDKTKEFLIKHLNFVKSRQTVLSEKWKKKKWTNKNYHMWFREFFLALPVLFSSSSSSALW